MFLSVIIPVYISKYFSADRLILSLEGYNCQTLSVDRFEIIVIDDGSYIDVEAEVRNKIDIRSNIRFYRFEHKGMCSAINMGVNKSKGDLLLVGVDDDVPERKALEKALEYFAKSKNERLVGIAKEPFLNYVAGMKNIIKPEFFRGINKYEYCEKYGNELSEFSGISVSDIANRFDELLKLGQDIKVNRQFEYFLNNSKLKSYHWLTVRPGNLFIYKSFLNEIGGFETDFDPSGWYSDLELGYRISNTGGEVVYLNQVVLLHLNHIRLFSNPKEEERCYDLLANKYRNNIDILFLPLLWLDSDLGLYSKYLQRIKKYIQLADRIEEK